MAIGVEKLKDSGFSGLVVTQPPSDGTESSDDRAGAVLAARARLLQEVRRSTRRRGKEVLARIAWKNHANGAKNPKAQFRKEVPLEHDPQARRASPVRSASWTARA